MKGPFGNTRVDPIVGRYLRTSPNSADKACLKVVLRGIDNGSVTLSPSRLNRGLYFVVDCNHRILVVISGDIRTATVIDISPYP